MDKQLNEELPILNRVRMRLAQADDTAMPKILTGLLPRLLTRLDKNSLALINTENVNEVQLRTLIQAHILGILSHAIERCSGNEYMEVPWLPSILPNLEEAQRHVTLTMLFALLKIALPRVKDSTPNVLDAALACLLRVVDKIHRRMLENPTEPNRMDCRGASWLCWDIIAIMFNLGSLVDVDLVDFDPSKYREPEKEMVPTKEVLDVIHLDGAGVLALFHDVLLYQCDDVQLAFQPSTGLSREGENRINHRLNKDRQQWSEEARHFLKQLKFSCLKYAIWPLNKGLFQGSDGSTNYKRCLLLSVLMASNNSEVGRLANDCLNEYLVRQKLEKSDNEYIRVKDGVCDLSLAVSLLLLVLGDKASKEVRSSHTTEKNLWEDILGPRPEDDELQWPPLPPSMTARTLSFLGSHFSIAEEQKMTGLQLFLDLVVAVQMRQGQGCFSTMSIINTMMLEIDKTPTLWDDLSLHVWRERSFCAAVGVIKACLDPSTPTRAQNVFGNPPQGEHEDVEIEHRLLRNQIQNQRRPDLTYLIARHRKSQRKRSLQVEEAVKAREISYCLIARLADVSHIQTGESYSFDLPIMLFRSSQLETEMMQPLVTKSLSALLRVYKQSLLRRNENDFSQLQSTAAFLLPVLLETIVGDSVPARICALNWVNEFLSRLDPLASRYLLQFMIEDEDLKIARAASQASINIAIPIGLPTRRYEPVFRFLNALKDSELNVLESEIRDRADVVGAYAHLSGNEALLLLLDHNFSVEKVIQLLREDRDATLANSGIVCDISLCHKNDSSFCEVCYCAGISTDKMYGIGCSHDFCRDCWSAYIHNLASEGRNLLDARCPSQSCVGRVTLADIHEISPESVPEWKRNMIKSFLYKDHSFTACPSPNCSIITWCLNGQDGSVTCPECQASFCFRCHHQPHTPASCSALAEWNLLFGDSRFWIKKHTKPCPGCSAPIEKTTGCNHMRCTLCQFDFCWVCLTRLESHLAPHTCNRYDQLQNEDSDLQRRIFYSERFQAHEEAEIFAKRLLDKANHILQKLIDRMFFLGEEDALAFEEACQTLVDARGFLKYSYVAAFGSLEHSPTMRTFEDHQGALELFVEKFNQLLVSNMETIYIEKGSKAVHRHFGSISFFSSCIKRYIERVEGIVHSVPVRQLQEAGLK
jgi:hypothetical protein